jgi:hypothetical protein
MRALPYLPFFSIQMHACATKSAKDSNRRRIAAPLLLRERSGFQSAKVNYPTIRSAAERVGTLNTSLAISISTTQIIDSILITEVHDNGI